MIVLLIVFLIILGYSTIGLAVAATIGYIRAYDSWRHDYAKTERTFSNWSNSFVMATVWPGVLWPFIGIPFIAYHLWQVDWNKRERQLIRQIRAANDKKVNAKLEETLEVRRAEVRAKLEADIQRMEAQSQRAQEALSRI